METRLKDVTCRYEALAQAELSDAERLLARAELLVQIGFLSHERLIHLLVTLSFACFTLMTVLALHDADNPALYALLVLLLCLLVPYIRHYFVLENGVQKLYGIADRLLPPVQDPAPEPAHPSDGTNG